MTCDKGHHPPEWCAEENCFVCARCGIFLCQQRRIDESTLALSRKEFRAKARAILYAPVQDAIKERFASIAANRLPDMSDAIADFHRFASRGYSFPTTGDLCYFCLCSRSAGPTTRCTYDGQHEWPPQAKPLIKATKKPDAKLCVKCGLHPQNPTSKTNGCEHSFP